MILRLIILACLSLPSAIISNAQDCLDVINKMLLYSKADEIFNGTKWVYPKRFLGSPMLVENYWPKADIVYSGIRYESIFMNYDIFKNDIIIYNPEKFKEKYIVINKDKLQGFSYLDTASGRKHDFVYSELPGISGKALYETITTGIVTLYIKPVKQVMMRSSDKVQGQYSEYFLYFLKIGERCTGFQSKSQLTSLLGNHATEVQRFIRKNKLKINTTHPRDIVAVITFYEGLK